MTKENLYAAIFEAQKFLRLAKIVQALNESRRNEYFTGSKETGAVKRSSMDLSRALTKIRH